MLRGPSFGVALLIGVASVSTPRFAHADAALPAKAQANVLARVLAYDSKLKARAGDAVVVGIVYAPASNASTAEADEMFTAFKGLEKFVLLGLPLRVEKIAYTDGNTLKAAIKERGIDALFVCTALDADITPITTVTRDLDVISMTAARRYVSAGVAIGSVVVENKPSILFNRKASDQEGSQFTSQFLGLTTAVDGD